MADRWMDERGGDWRDRDWRDRDWRRSEAYGRGEGRMGETRRWGEDRSWSGPAGGDRGPYGEGGEAYRGRSGASQDYAGRNYADEAGRPDYGARGREAYGRGGYEREARRASADYGERRGREDWDERRDRGEGSGDFLQRAGERIGSWFRGENLMRGGRDEGQGEDREPRRYRADFGREDRWEIPGRGHRGLGPKGYRRSDERISEEVHDRLTDDPWLDASNIEVEVKDGEVTLKGHVDSREAKHRAERVIEDLSGVRHVQNNLRVNPEGGLTSAGRGYGSSLLEAEMRRDALERDPGNLGASGLSGRTSTGAAAERSTGTATETSVDPKTGVKR